MERPKKHAVLSLEGGSWARSTHQVIDRKPFDF
jgi:hypothetical protein